MLRVCASLSACSGLRVLLKPRHHVQLTHGVKREASSWRNPFTVFGRKTPEAYARYDGLNPSQDRLVYSSGLHSYMLLASIATTSLAAGCVCYVGCSRYLSWSPATQRKGSWGVVWGEMSSTEKGVLQGIIAVYVLCSLYFLRCLPVRIYYNKSQQVFRMVFQGILPGLHTSKNFKPGALEPVRGRADSSIVHLLGKLRLKGGRQRFIIFEDRFAILAFYNVLAGYDNVDALPD